MITTRFKEEPVAQCTEPECKTLDPRSSRTRARQHTLMTGHTVRIIVEDVTIYREGQ